MRQPAYSDFANGDDVLLVADGTPDSLGRQQHFAFWIDDNVGYSCDEVGIRGQVFFSAMDEHLARLRERGKTGAIL